MPKSMGPIPTQIELWQPGDLVDEADEHGQWLTCLRDTGPNDRLVVWEGAHGRGLVAVVDFAEQRRSTAPRVYEGWARVQPLDPIIRCDAIAREPCLASKLLGKNHGMQGSPKRLTAEQGSAIARMTRLPARAVPIDEPNYDEEVLFWADDDHGPPEAVLEDRIHSERWLWQKLGFPSVPRKQFRLPSGRRPDLLAPGVVADVKRLVRRDDGPGQLEAYLEELDHVQPAHKPWRGLLVHAHDADLDAATVERLEQSRYSGRVEVWGVIEYEEKGTEYEEVVSLYPRDVDAT